MEDVAGDVGGQVARKEHKGVGHVDRIAHAAQRRLELGLVGEVGGEADDLGVGMVGLDVGNALVGRLLAAAEDSDLGALLDEARGQRSHGSR